MTQRLGSTHLASLAVRVQEVAPQYATLLRIPYDQLTSGGGLGNDYVVVAGGRYGVFHQFSVNPNLQARLRVGLYIGGEVVGSWSSSSIRGNPCSAPQKFGIPFQIVAMVRDWPPGVDGEIRAQWEFLDGTVGSPLCFIEDVWGFQLDLVRMGGARTGTGWSGWRAVVAETFYPGGRVLSQSTTENILSTGLLPWDTGSHSWVAFWSYGMHPKSARSPMSMTAYVPTTDTWGPPVSEWREPVNIRARTPRFGTAGALDGDEHYAIGSWHPFVVENGTTSVRVVGRSGILDNPSMIEGGTIFALRLDYMDAAFTAFTPGGTAGRVGYVPGFATQLNQGDLTRPVSDALALSRVNWARHEIGGMVPAVPAVMGTAKLNGWAQSSRDPVVGISTFSVIAAGESIPNTTAARVPPGSTAAGNGVALEHDHFADPQQAGPPYLMQGHEPAVLIFAPSDFGAIDDPDPPVLSEVVLIPDREADFGSLPTFPVEPSRSSVPTIVEESGAQRSPDGYEHRWGGPHQPRRTVTAEWVDIDQANANSLSASLLTQPARAYRWQATGDYEERGWLVVRGSVRHSLANGLHRFTADLVSLRYLD